MDERGRHPEADTGEGQARATLDLLGVQTDLLKALKETGKPLVVVLIHGRVYTINWIAENADAIVDAWYPGEAGGTAVAEVLFGDYNPGGKLTVSVPRHVGQLPVYYYHRMRATEALRSRRRRTALSVRFWSQLHDVPVRQPQDRPQSIRQGDRRKSRLM